MAAPTKIPHSLRIAILFLRLALGLNFAYLAFSILFDPLLGKAVGNRAFDGFYAWLANSSASAGWLHPFAQWAFLIIGVCLILGIATRFASIVGIVLVFLSYLPNVSYSALSLSQFINDEVIVIICLLILIFANAGSYFGIDKFIHISFKHGKE